MLTAGHVNGICEPGASRAYGAWAEGHHDRDHFARIVSDEWQRPVSATDVRVGYYRVSRGVMHFTTTKGRGASPVTWAEW